jgi:hypothetical protein
LKGDVELDFNDEKDEKVDEKETQNLGKTYDIGPTTSKTIIPKKSI